MIIFVSEEPERRLAIVSNLYALVLKPVGKKPSDKPLCAIELLQKSDLKKYGFKRLTSHEIFGVIGLIEVNGLLFVGAITGKSKVAQPCPGETVNKIFAVDFFCLNDNSWDFIEIDSSGYPVLPETASTEYQDALPKHPCYELKKLLSNGSFYYSSDFDLTSTLQHRGYGQHSLSTDTYEEEYMWNSFLMQEMITYRDHLDTNLKQILDDEGFLTTVIRGFAETFVSYVKKLKVALTIISKQSWKRAGTRFNARGVDDEANVANFVETEFIMYSSQYCYAFTQIRGSIPVFWEQGTSLINPRVQITRSFEATQPVFDKHIMKSVEKYGPVHVVNLLSTKSSEIELSKRYKEHLTHSKKLNFNKDIFLTEFDFHKETSQEGFSGVRKLIPLILDSLLSSGYYSYDVREKKNISEQHGIFRTNCLDCLDRTNLAQQIISLAAFRTFLEDFRLISSNSFIDDDDFVSKHNTLWADHGSFNVNGATKQVDLSKWLFPIGEKFKPDIVVLGLQEVIELSAGSILNADYSKSSFWENLVGDCLNQYDDKYLLLRVEQMTSLLILFFVKADKAKYVKQVEGATKKTGFRGMAGNKGAVSIRFEYGATSFCFVNSHLAAGATNVEERRSDYESIVRGITFTRTKMIPHHDFIFWLGDMNYRINLPNEDVRRELHNQEEGYIDKLLHFDQLTLGINSGSVFEGFKEPTLKFRPTYKYDPGTGTYDSSEKERTPSWTDRIIYKGENLLPLSYSDAPIMISDHRPVYAAYRAKITFVDEKERLSLKKRLFTEYKQEHPEEPGSLISDLLSLDLDNKSTDGFKSSSESSLLDIDPIMAQPTASSVASSSPVSSASASLQPVRTQNSSQSRTPIKKPVLRPHPHLLINLYQHLLLQHRRKNH
ncbi:CEI_1a_G0049660.mRNA.1.CDS.1 [Saccharomyces cerevisiae]|nr:CEI_1a_G0049660.mRNA.1.CDS.1 [Saccharomyces cerevisiae]CAI7460651.1 CEI_1a_G0049660.mRNA.1.CDS.1 [Saccharomyces cerevisiae]